MCLISVLPKGTNKNSEEVYNFIKSGANCNSDGSGYMYKKSGNNKIIINKGFFNVDYLIESIKKLNLTEEDELVIHHRIGTLGEISAENTHPFVITKDNEESRKIDLITNKPCMVHNGIFWGIREFEKLNKDLSDTYAFSRYIMPDMMDILENNKDLFDFLLSSTIGNDKLCFLRPNADLLMIGNFIEKNGYYHSNSGYCRQVFNKGGVESENFMNAGTFSEGHSTNKNVPASLSLYSKNTNNNQSNTNKLTINKFDNTVIKITNKNFHHFKFISKYIYDTITNNDNIRNMCWEINGFDENALMQDMFKNNDSGIGSSHIAAPTSSLNSEYFYIPKNDNYVTVYKDLFNLVAQYPKFSKNGYKNLEKIINNNYHKSDFDSIKYGKIQKRVFKLTLRLYKEYLDDCKKLMDYNASKIINNEHVPAEVTEFLEVVVD